MTALPSWVGRLFCSPPPKPKKPEPGFAEETEDGPPTSSPEELKKLGVGQCSTRS